jgi:hypothetical protein
VIRIEGYDDHTPTRRLIAAISEIAPGLTTDYDRRYADVTITSRRTDLAGAQNSATADAWYDLYWTHPALAMCHDHGQEYVDVVHHRIEHLTTLPPPPRIPAEERIAAAGPVTLDGFSDRAISLYGGAEALRESLQNRREIAIRCDRSVDAYDWTTLARQAVDVATAAPPRKLTPTERVLSFPPFVGHLT